jgi:hypothetical protein
LPRFHSFVFVAVADDATNVVVDGMWDKEEEDDHETVVVVVVEVG